MKAIKKVEVVPLDYNIGKIINSALSSDDKTKNTYSMKIIDDKIGATNQNLNNLSNNVYIKDDYAILTGTVTLVDGTVTTTISYPTGFTNANSVVLTIGMQSTSTSSTNRYNYGYGNTSIYYSNGLINRRISLGDSEITFQVSNSTQSGTGNASYNYKIVLMKIN